MYGLSLCDSLLTSCFLKNLLVKRGHFNFAKTGHYYFGLTLIKASKNLSPVFRDITNSMLNSTKQRFGKGEAPDDTKWAKNSAVTIKKKKSDRPLIDSQELVNTIAINSSDKEAEIYSSKDESKIIKMLRIHLEDSL